MGAQVHSRGCAETLAPFLLGGSVMGYFVIVAFCGACWIAFEGV